MARRIAWSVVGLILCLPLVRLANEEWGRKPEIDFNSKEWKARTALITRARVFVAKQPDIASLDFSKSPNDPAPFNPAAPLECRYVYKPITATTAKFHCELPDGDEIKVKYGWTREKSAEVAASRLLAALGFGADHMTMVERVRCKGCPPFPFEMAGAAEAFYAPWLLEFVTPKDKVREFTWVSVERKMAGRSIEVGEHEGWDWDELERVDASKGGATRAELDAFRLMAVFLSHWDNKATNQRLVCEEREGNDDDPLAPCRRPLLIIQDVGATFGPGKVVHSAWAETPIWADDSGCRVTLESMPYRGGRFEPSTISEEGRRLLADRLTKLSEEQIRALFLGARFPDADGYTYSGDVAAWVKTFQDKVRLIADRRCPAAST